MRSRAARASIPVFVTFCLLAVPSAAAAEQPEDRPGAARSASAQEKRAERGKPAAAPTTSPQPKSNADLNKGGANNGGDCGAYCSTRDGSPSRNGKGDGEAKGKPCAGCVGKADNKNPPGQAPSGVDGNAGYECDRNQGIGQSNPAHTGCVPPPSVAPTTAPPPPVPVCVPSAADPCTPPPSVLPTKKVVTPAPKPSPTVLGVKIVRPRANPPAVAAGRLPSTGTNASVALLLLLGFGLVAAGVATTVSGPARQR